MLTRGIENAVEHLIEDTFLAGALPDAPASEIIADRKREVLTLIRAEAINLADKIIGKDRVLHSTIDSHGDEYFDPADKAVFDFQVAQRLKLSEYQSPPKESRGVVIGSEEIINPELSENEE
jgi:hypothetical protein